MDRVDSWPQVCTTILALSQSLNMRERNFGFKILKYLEVGKMQGTPARRKFLKVFFLSWCKNKPLQAMQFLKNFAVNFNRNASKIFQKQTT